MKQLKNYSNLYALYRRSRNSLLIPFLVFLVLFILGFPTFLVDMPFAVSLILMLMIFPTIVMGISYLIVWRRTVKNFAQFSPQELLEINNEIPMHQCYEGFLVTRHAVLCNCKKSGLMLCPVRNLLWIYRDVTTGKLYGVIPIYKYTMLVIAERNQKRNMYRIKNKSKVVDFLKWELSKYRMDIIYGYENGLDNLFRNDINRMIALAGEYARRQVEPVPQNVPVGIKVGMNINYLDSLPEVKNKYRVGLMPGEKVIFTAKLTVFESDTGVLLGTESCFTMTNRRMIADNGKGIWTTEIAEDIMGWRKEERGKGLLKSVSILVALNKEVTFGIGVQKLSGYRFCFNKNDTAVFENIMSHVMG